MSDRIRCEFCLVRYIPNVVRAEFVNIGVLLWRSSPSDEARTEVRFTQDWGRVCELDPDADCVMLQALTDEMATRLQESFGVERETSSFLHLILDSFSTSVQIFGPQTTLAEDPSTEMNRLMQMYIDN